MPWVEIFAVFIVSHLVGDFLLQTDVQAMHKRGGLGGNGISPRSLLSHTLTYTLAFVPALIWLAGDLGLLETIGVALLIAVPHMVQDDGRLLDVYMRRVKGVGDPRPGGLLIAVDQSFHLLALFLVALLAGN
jgi:type IV secretory pathway TrbD component